MTVVTTHVMAITDLAVLATDITLDHAVTQVITAVIVDVDLAVVGTPPPIAVTGPTPAPDLARLVQHHVMATETEVGTTVGLQASLTPTRMSETGAGSCLIHQIGGDDTMLWHASPCADYLV